MDLTKSYPRPGHILLGGYPWLARCIDKARAYNEGTLGDYIYPCPIDKELLGELNFTGEELAEIVDQSKTDEDVLEHLGLPVENTDPAVERWAKNFLNNRHDSLVRQAEEEEREYDPPEEASAVRPFA
jgi:hypothetical protein